MRAAVSSDVRGASCVRYNTELDSYRAMGRIVTRRQSAAGGRQPLQKCNCKYSLFDEDRQSFVLLTL
jgi:hypothetical protein